MRLPRLVGQSRALEIIMTGRTVRADEALRIRLAESCSGPEQCGKLPKLSPTRSAGFRLSV